MPIIFAATDENATGTAYYIPEGPSQLSGKPIKVKHPEMEIAPTTRTKLMRYTALQTALKWEHRIGLRQKEKAFHVGLASIASYARTRHDDLNKVG